MTVAIPLADLTILEQEGGWRVEATLSMGIVDAGGSFSDLAQIPMRLALSKQPGPGALARHRMTLKLRRTKQRLVFIVRDPVGGATLWGDVEVNP